MESEPPYSNPFDPRVLSLVGGETVVRKKIIEAIEDKTVGETAYGSLRPPGHEKRTI
jgi:hypothetical protein